MVILILVLKNNPFLVETPESYLEKAEDMIFGVIMPDKKIEKYKGTKGSSEGKGKKIGTAYQLENGEIIYIPESIENE